MFRPLRTAVPRQARSISLLDNVKKILGRGTPTPAPTPTEEVKIEKVGGGASSSSTAAAAQRRNKVIGFDVDVPQKLHGVALIDAVRAACEGSNLNGESLSEDMKLELARTIQAQTGYLVPDAVLNNTSTTGDAIVHHFERLERPGTARYPVLTLDEASLPRNVRIAR